MVIEGVEEKKDGAKGSNNQFSKNKAIQNSTMNIRLVF